MEKRTQQGKLTNLEIASFCSEMAMILKSGISSLEGVDLLREDAQTKAEKELLDEIYQSVMDTGRLDQALEETKVFPEYLIRMTQIGEETGTLDEVMESLAEHYNREEAIRRSVRSAISYPLLMIGMMLVIIIILMTKVMPVFDQVFRIFKRDPACRQCSFQIFGGVCGTFGGDRLCGYLFYKDRERQKENVSHRIRVCIFEGAEG